MNKKLFQEILEFRKYRDCLDKALHEEYRNYLTERVLNEITASQLSNNFINGVFTKNEIDSSDATVNVKNRYTNILQNLTYERKQIGKNKTIVPNEFTHLESDTTGNYCDKETFRKEFETKSFRKYDKEDLSADTLARELLDSYLENFDDAGWLILKKDDYKIIKGE